MLFNVLLVILVVYLMFMPLVIVELIKFGIRIAVSCVEDREEKREIEAKAESVTAKVAKSVKRKTGKPKITPQQQKTLDILANIDAYDGTDIGQKEIK